MEPEDGDRFDIIKCESFYDKTASKIRVRPLSGQGIPTHWMIECNKKERKMHLEGTRFRACNVKVCVKPNGAKYLRPRDQMIHVI
jgi:hypothetical protein